MTPSQDPAHHPAEAILVDYVGGALRPAFGVVVAAHVESCARCREHVAALEAVGGALVAELAPTAMGVEALDRVMAGIDRPPAEVSPSPKPAAERIAFGRTTWLAPGMSIRKAKMDGGDLLYMLRLPAGLQTIPHTHGGIEFTTVLKGAFDDGTGVFAAGDFAEMTPAIDHQPSVLPGSECICLIASEQPMRVRTMIGRLVHLLTGV
jgi:putative transcriptional regulator